MNKDDYKKAFSGVRPSDETVERIFEMSEKKSRKMRHKGLIVAIACLVALLCGTLTANAATDGALFEGINLIVNGEDVNLVDYIKSHDKYVTDDGTEVEAYEFEIPNDENDSASIGIQAADDEENGTQSESSSDDNVRYELN